MKKTLKQVLCTVLSISTVMTFSATGVWADGADTSDGNLSQTASLLTDDEQLQEANLLAEDEQTQEVSLLEDEGSSADLTKAAKAGNTSVTLTSADLTKFTAAHDDTVGDYLVCEPGAELSGTAAGEGYLIFDWMVTSGSWNSDGFQLYLDGSSSYSQRIRGNSTSEKNGLQSYRK